MFKGIYMFKVGNIISYQEMCSEEKTSLQKGMNFRVKNNLSIILMSLRKNAPYADKIEEGGRVLIYEGHDVAKYKTLTQDPKKMDQPMYLPSGQLSENGKFYNAVLNYKRGHQEAELVKVYEKIMPGVWSYNGIFKLIDAWQEKSSNRKVFKFKLELTNNRIKENVFEIEHNRLIPTDVKKEVWKRDKGCCVICGNNINLHFDHIIPFSKGGSSITAKNIQLLCAKCNLSKNSKII